ncbi:tRNA wybutosine-synthesizing protein 4 [Cytospora mali]|uniref:tRNA wybutosine-synthesizing protein 4 n=1 Tax=Cytospora mali TaxID=578113 RepID=A0A194WBA0_CYTMA|nr:tRNA wybutosine-synthesizing protein 4 [Valsa mali]
MGAHKSHGTSKSPTDTKTTAQDDLVMATNSSSIVSKRSVERLYYPDEPHFFRFFVKKFQRRAPLINRGYHLRLHVIDVTLRNFLRQPSPKRKVVVNLGCGSDVIPWQCWTRYPENCHQSQAVFVDVDFPDLIKKKRQVVLTTPVLVSPLSGLKFDDNDETCPHVLLRSDRYFQVGCDLRRSAVLEQALASIVDVKECLFLFVAEVSITYMETEHADSLIKWASTLGQAEFCLLEQILPDGPDHPFARTMTDHFEKLSTPIKSVKAYPTIQHQHSRFGSRGWLNIQLNSLWSAWCDGYFLAPEDRRKLDEVEAFDEWEEFALFASHYMILHAKNYGEESAAFSSNYLYPKIPSTVVPTTYKQLIGHAGLRRFGAAVVLDDAFGRQTIMNCMGLGSTTRLPSYDLYKLEGSSADVNVKPEGPTSRMCYTFTDIGHSMLLVGGRLSPSRAIKDCWVFKRESSHWERTWDLPIPLYRHSACRLAGSFAALVVGGKSNATDISDKVLVYHPDRGWLRCSVQSSVQPKPVFGALLICSEREQQDPPVFIGFLIGGMPDDGTVQTQIMAWKLVFHDSQAPTITFSPADIASDGTATILPRLGAVCVQDHSRVVVLGGVGCNGIIPREDEIIVCSFEGAGLHVSERITIPTTGENTKIPRPLIVGSSIAYLQNGQVVILGGGATCFSMGTFWTKGTYTLAIDNRYDGSQPFPSPPRCWELSKSGEIVSRPPGPAPALEDNRDQPAEFKSVPRINVASRELFDNVVQERLPVVMEGMDLGPCRNKWTLEYLKEQIGGDRKVVVHESNIQNMDFAAKNFRYTPMAFETFSNQIKNGAHVYLRALSVDAPADQPARLDQDFPAVASDFTLPEELNTCVQNMHSSVLRISGPVNMWLHYDVQANIYCQINGSKRMLLFPPSDVTRLGFAPGASSSSIDVFSSLDSSTLAGTHPWEVNLGPGDILFLPPLWLHTATPSTDFSIAVNVFFRNLDSGYSVGRDVYGNRDLAVYEKGRQDISRIDTAFGSVPADARQFYMLRLADELFQKAHGGS